MRLLFILLIAALALYFITRVSSGSLSFPGASPTPIAAVVKPQPHPTRTVTVREIKGTPIFELGQLDSKPFRDPGLEPATNAPEPIASPESSDDIESQLERLPLPTLAVTPGIETSPTPIPVSSAEISPEGRQLNAAG